MTLSLRRLSLIAAAVFTGCSDYGLQGSLDPNHNPSPTDQQDGAVFLEEVCNGLDDDLDGEVDEGFEDVDGDGIADCIDGECDLEASLGGVASLREECDGDVMLAVEDPWSARVEWQVDLGWATSIYALPTVGHLDDDNGDGVIGSGDVPDIVFTDTKRVLHVLSGDTGVEVWRLEGYNARSIPIVELDPSSPGPELVVLNTSDGAELLSAGGELLWGPVDVRSHALWWMTQPTTVADLDGDGLPEIIIGQHVLNGEDGSIDFILPRSNMYPVHSHLVADLDGDGLQEIIYGEHVCNTVGRCWTTQQRLSFITNHAVDWDLDGDAELLVIAEGVATVYDNEEAIASFPYDNPAAVSLCSADFDGDGLVEFATVAYELTVMSELDGTSGWSKPTVLPHGHCSAADLDGDGDFEMLASGTDSALIIRSGRTGSVLLQFLSDPTSGPGASYPVIADIDADGAAEVLVARFQSQTGLALLAIGHDGDGWSPAGQTWGLYNYAVTNILDDGTIPPAPDYWTHGMFRARPPYLTVPAQPDLEVSVVDLCVASCDGGLVRVAWQVANHGPQPVLEPFTVGIYLADGPSKERIATFTIDGIDGLTILPSRVFEFSVTAARGRTLEVRVDEEDVVSECDEANNIGRWHEAVCAG